MLLNDHSTRFPGFSQPNRTLQSKYIQILKICVWQPAYTCSLQSCIFPFRLWFLPPSSTAETRPPRPSTGSRLLPELAISLWSPPRRGTTSCGEKDDQFRTNEKSNQEVLLHVCCRGILLACWYVISKRFERSVTSLETELYLAVNDCFFLNHCYQSLIILILWHQSSPKVKKEECIQHLGSQFDVWPTDIGPSPPMIHGWHTKSTQGSQEKKGEKIEVKLSSEK